MQKTFTTPKPGVLYFVVLFLFTNFFTAKANHEVAQAVEISYKHLKGDSVLVTVHAYLGCNGLSPSNLLFDITVTPEKSTAFKIKTKYVNTTLITSYVKKGQCTRCTNTGCALALGTV